jgi:hypothetical protein
MWWNNTEWIFILLETNKRYTFSGVAVPQGGLESSNICGRLAKNGTV